MTKEEMIKEIEKLKKEKNAIILAHYYQKDTMQNNYKNYKMKILKFVL